MNNTISVSYIQVLHRWVFAVLKLLPSSHKLAHAISLLTRSFKKKIKFPSFLSARKIPRNLTIYSYLIPPEHRHLWDRQHSQIHNRVQNSRKKGKHLAWDSRENLAFYRERQGMVSSHSRETELCCLWSHPKDPQRKFELHSLFCLRSMKW